MKQLLILMIVSVLVGCSTSSGESAKRLTEKAVTLTTPASGKAELHQSLSLLDEAIALDDEYLPAKQQRVRVLVRLGRLDEAAEEANSVAELTGRPQDYFFQCMAREASKPEYREHKECYREAGRRYESQLDEPATDVNYILTLKLAGSDQFEKAAENFLDSLSAQASQELFEPLLRQSARDEIISDIFFSRYPAQSERGTADQ